MAGKQKRAGGGRQRLQGPWSDPTGDIRVQQGAGSFRDIQGVLLACFVTGPRVLGKWERSVEVNIAHFQFGSLNERQQGHLRTQWQHRSRCEGEARALHPGLGESDAQVCEIRESGCLSPLWSHLFQNVLKTQASSFQQ